MSREVLYFGCLRGAGHFLRSKSAGTIYGASPDPWGTKLDGGLLTDNYCGANTTPTGDVVEAHKGGWTAISFWDRSGGDSRPGCNSTFLIEADIPGGSLLSLAKEQWPEIFARKNFPELKLKPTPAPIPL